MAGVPWVASTNAVAINSVAKTVMQLTAANNIRNVLEKIHISPNGADSSAARIYCRILTQTNAGTATNSTITKRDTTMDETLQITASENASAEPAAGTVIWKGYLDPTQCQIPELFDHAIPGNSRLGIEMTTSASSISVICTAYGWE